MKNEGIKTDTQKYWEQLEKYYHKQLSSHLLIKLGMTPNLLQQFGAPALPLVMLQSTLTKCVRKATGSRSAHELPKNIIETLPEQINRPIFLVQDNSRNSIVLISDKMDKNDNNILIAVRLNETQKNSLKVNEIKSIYGKTNLKEYLLRNNEKKQLYIIDKEKAEKLSRIVGLQLPMAETTFDFVHNVPPNSDAVKDESEK